MKEVGIYRVSGLSSDVQRLKKAFETSSKLLIPLYFKFYFLLISIELQTHMKPTY